MNWETEMNLLCYLLDVIFAFLPFLIALGLVVLRFKKLFFHDMPRCMKKCFKRLCKLARRRYRRLQHWWKNDRDTWLTNLDMNLSEKWRFIDQHKNSFIFFVAIIVGIIFAGFILVAWFKTTFIEFSTIVGAILAFIISFMTLVRMFRQFHNQAKQIETQAKHLERQAVNDQKKIAVEQFKNAIENLGNKNQAIVLGGVHALHNLAMTFPKEYSKQVLEVLCSFIRAETTRSEHKERLISYLESIKPSISQVTPQKPVAPLIVIQTIVDKLFREKIELDEINEKTGEKRILYRNHMADLSGAFLRGVDFWNANLSGTRLWQTDLHGVRLWKANLQGASLWDANLHRANLRDAKLQGTGLLEARLQETNLVNADCRGIQSDGKIILREKIMDAIKNNKPLETDMSGVTLYDDEGNKRDLDEDGKKAWFIEQSKRDEVVDDLSAEDVQEIFKDWK